MKVPDIRGKFWLIINSIIITLFLFLFTFPAFAAPPKHLKPPKGVGKQQFVEAYRRATGLQTVYRAIFSSVSNSVVSISVKTRKNAAVDGSGGPFKRFKKRLERTGSDNMRILSGTGFIIDSRGVIVTNSHVVGSAKRVTVKLSNGRLVTGRVTARDTDSDIAIIKIRHLKNLKAVRLGNSKSVSVGDLTIAVGNPFGFDGTFTTGVVSAVHRRGLDKLGGTFIQTDASINHGNSGGPLLNLRGEVIGINRMIVSPTGGSVGIGFAIPIDNARRVIAQLRTRGKVRRPMLGIRITPIPTAGGEKATQVSHRGVFVQAVLKGSGAWKAGLETNDIILKVDGQPVNEPSELISYVLQKRVGERVTLYVLRGKRLQRLKVKLGTRD